MLCVIICANKELTLKILTIGLSIMLWHIDCGAGIKELSVSMG
jgi:hypothetical protein